MKKKWVFGVMVAVVVLSACVALAVAQDETTEYYACVNNGSGTIRMINEGEECNANDIKIVWNQVGPQGPKGDNGEPGQSCSVVQNEGSVTINCPGGTSATVNDGLPGPGCQDCQNRIDNLEAQVADLEARVSELEPPDCSGNLWRSRWCEHGDGTVTDVTTGLVWTQDAYCLNWLVWQSAVWAANGLEDGECGLTDGSEPGDWRLPSLDDFLSLKGGVEGIWYSSPDPFNNVQTGYYWTSTDNGYDDIAVAVGMSADSWTWNGKANTNRFVWAVRDGQ